MKDEVSASFCKRRDVVRRIRSADIAHVSALSGRREIPPLACPLALRPPDPLVDEIRMLLEKEAEIVWGDRALSSRESRRRDQFA